MRFFENLAESLHFTNETLCNPFSRWIILVLLGLPWLILSLAIDWTTIIAGTSIRWEAVPWPVVVPLAVSGIICTLLQSGYTVRIFRGEHAPPEFDHWPGLLLDGIRITLVSLLWLLPVIILLAAQFALLLDSLKTMSFVMLLLVPFLMIGTLVVFLIISVLGTIGAIRYSRTGRVREAFAIRSICTTIGSIGWLHYLVALLFLFVLGLLFSGISWALHLIPYAGAVIVTGIAPILLIFRCRFITNVYDNYSAGQVPVPAPVEAPSPEAPVSPVAVLAWGVLLALVIAAAFIPLYLMISSVMPPLPAMTMDELEQTKLDDISVRSTEGYYSAPVFSHDGSRIFFVATTRPATDPANYTAYNWENDIWTMSGRGENQTRLTRIGTIDTFVKSPASDTFAFTEYRNGSTSVYLMSALSHDVVRLPGPQAHTYFSSWSPDGKRIAVTGFNISDYSGWSVMPDGGHAPATGEEWSRLYVMNADGSGPKELGNASVPMLSMGMSTESSWNPEGTQIVAPLYAPDSVDIAVSDTATGYTRVVANNTLHESQGYPYRVEPYPRWSPNGDLIAFLRDGDVWVVRPDGTGQKKIAGDGTVEALAWSPDGMRLAFSADSYLGFVSPDGTGPERIANIQPHALSWSPDGKTIVYAPGMGSRIRITTLTPAVLKMGGYQADQMDMMMSRMNATAT